MVEKEDGMKTWCQKIDGRNIDMTRGQGTVRRHDG